MVDNENTQAVENRFEKRASIAFIDAKQVHQILHDQLGLSKISVPGHLGCWDSEQKVSHSEVCQRIKNLIWEMCKFISFILLENYFLIMTP